MAEVLNGNGDHREDHPNGEILVGLLTTQMPIVVAITSDDRFIIGIPPVCYDHLFQIDSFVGNSSCVSKEMDDSRNKILPNLLMYTEIQ